MLNAWTELLPLFIVRWLAKRYCEQVPYSYEGKQSRVFATARPDILVKIPQK